MKNWTKYTLFGLVALSLTPYLWLVSRAELLGSNLQVLGNMLGLIGSTLIVWQFVLRNRYFSKLFNDDYLAINEVHKFIGIWGMLLVFTHPLIEKLSYMESTFWVLQFNFTGSSFERSVSFGRTAFFILLFTWILSALLRKKLPYRLWRRTHLIVYFIMPLILLHAPVLGTFLNSIPVIRTYWWAIMGLWAGLVAARLLGYFNVGKSRYRLLDKKTLPGNITRYTFEPLGKKLRPKPGQFMYVRGFFFSEVHPFSAMEFDESTGNITFGIKQVGKYTRQLEGIPIGATVYLDGPYGVFTREGHNEEPKVIIAGGIGITPFVELVRRFGAKDTYLIYANRTLDIVVNRQEFKRELKDNYIDVISDDKKTNPPIIHGQLDKTILSQTLPKNSFKNSQFFICGPPPFMAGVQKNLLELGVDRHQIHSERFSL